VEEMQTLTCLLLLAGLLWVSGAFLHWQNMRAEAKHLRDEEKLADHLHRLALLRHAEMTPPVSLVGLAEDESHDDERVQSAHAWTPR
jgi:hypothetical protein